MTAATPAPMDAFWDEVDRRIDSRIANQVNNTLRNHRPRGNTNIAITVGSPGTDLTASMTVPWAHVHVPFPCKITNIRLKGSPAGTAYFDLWLQGPKQTYASAASIMGGAYPLLNADNEELIPADPAWTPFIPANSTLYLFVTYADTVQVATFNIIVKCV